MVVSAAVSTTQGAACWIRNARRTLRVLANAASSTVSSLRVARNGALTLLNGQAALMPGAGALDMAIAPDGSEPYVFGSRSPQSLYTCAVDDGTLTPLGTSVGPVASAAGVAAN